MEARYICPRLDQPAVRRLAGACANCLTYGVTNHYLDVEYGGFARAEMGAPRLRPRLYEAGPYRFGQLEHKRQATPERTEKQVWPAEQAWEELVGAMPWLRQVALRRPRPGDDLEVLTVAADEAAPAFGPLRYVGSLRYRRISCLGPGLRVTADSDFAPAVLRPDEVIVETKGERRLSTQVVRELRLRPLAVSKFALLSGVAAWNRDSSSRTLTWKRARPSRSSGGC